MLKLAVTRQGCKETHGRQGSGFENCRQVEASDNLKEGRCPACQVQVCIVDGLPLTNGTEREVDCLLHTCVNRSLIPTNPLSSTCNDPFVQENDECFHLHNETKTWCDGRRYCSSLGADLAVVTSDKFSNLETFLKDKASGQEVWVGVKAKKWLDQRDVKGSEWHSGEPNGADDDCARMKPANDQYALADQSCAKSFWILCMRK